MKGRGPARCCLQSRKEGKGRGPTPTISILKKGHLVAASAEASSTKDSTETQGPPREVERKPLGSHDPKIGSTPRGDSHGFSVLQEQHETIRALDAKHRRLEHEFAEYKLMYNQEAMQTLSTDCRGAIAEGKH